MAASLKEGQTINKVAGTIGFMAPEVLLEEPSDFKVDVWSLGVMLYALISSNVPFEGHDRDETAQMIIDDDVVFEDDIGADRSSASVVVGGVVVDVVPTEDG